jgi:hypothetical protein
MALWEVCVALFVSGVRVSSAAGQFVSGIFYCYKRLILSWKQLISLQIARFICFVAKR